MALEIKQTPKLVQQLVITPQLQQAIKLLQLTRLELVDLINQEIRENPVLEEEEEVKQSEGDEEYTLGEIPEGVEPEVEHTYELKGEGEGFEEFDWENYFENYNLNTFERELREDGEERPSFENFVAKKTNLYDHLKWQLELSHFTEEEKRIGQVIIGNLDEDGYLKITVEDIISEIHQSKEMVEEILKRIQQFDPIGVAA